MILCKAQAPLFNLLYTKLTAQATLTFDLDNDLRLRHNYYNMAYFMDKDVAFCTMISGTTMGGDLVQGLGARGRRGGTAGDNKLSRIEGCLNFER